MMLHEAIRLGAMITGKSDLFIETQDDGSVCTCTLGGAGRALGIHWLDTLPQIQTLYPFVLEDANCPLCQLDRPILEVVQFHLNTAGRNCSHSVAGTWTREAIADWLEPIERAWIARQPKPFDPVRKSFDDIALQGDDNETDCMICEGTFPGPGEYCPDCQTNVRAATIMSRPAR